jgi:hypothetical protein
VLGSDNFATDRGGTASLLSGNEVSAPEPRYDTRKCSIGSSFQAALASLRPKWCEDRQGVAALTVASFQQPNAFEQKQQREGNDD